MNVKKSILTLFVIGLVGLTSAAFAESNSQCVFAGSTVSQSQIEKNVQDQGFTLAKRRNSIELDDCVYKVKANDKSGQQWKLYFDPNNGNLIGKKQDKHD